MGALEAVILTIITASTPLLLAAMGELVVERSGVLNLGVEGMMVMGAVCGFGAALLTGNPYIGVLASIVAGVLMSVLFGFLTLSMVANQVATGLALEERGGHEESVVPGRDPLQGVSIHRRYREYPHRNQSFPFHF